MDAIQKLLQLSEYTQLEPAEETSTQGCSASSGGSACKLPEDIDSLIFEVATPSGRSIRLLKTLLTSACERDCFYCPFRSGRDFRRETFKPDDMSSMFMQLVRMGKVSGLFLSSGIAGSGVRSQDKILHTAEILRSKQSFSGYLHLKLMPGAEKDQVLQAMKLASRVSINLEAPSDHHLARLAPHKIFLEELLQPLQWAHEIRNRVAPQDTWNQKWPSLTTQFVVGGSDENDFDILRMTEYLYSRLNLARVYYSAFSPIPDTPLENHPAENPLRRERLFQASFLLRDYGYTLNDLILTPSGRLPLDTDPKLAWANVNLREQPVELNTANREQLLRIPGIGPVSAAKILTNRRKSNIRTNQDLQSLGINTQKMLPFILLNGKRPTQQLSFFSFC